MEQKNLLLLLSRVRRGDGDAFSLLCAEFEGMLQKAVHVYSARRCDADASELMHEARLALYRAACTYRDGEQVTFGLYARVCVRNALISFWRKRALPDDVSLCPYKEPEHGEEEDPVSLLLAQERVTELMHMMERALSEDEMQVFVRLIDGERTAEIAKALGKTVRSVSNTIYRVRCKARKVLEK